MAPGDRCGNTSVVQLKRDVEAIGVHSNWYNQRKKMRMRRVIVVGRVKAGPIQFPERSMYLVDLHQKANSKAPASGQKHKPRELVTRGKGSRPGYSLWGQRGGSGGHSHHQKHQRSSYCMAGAETVEASWVRERGGRCRWVGRGGWVKWLIFSGKVWIAGRKGTGVQMIVGEGSQGRRGMQRDRCRGVIEVLLWRSIHGDWEPSTHHPLRRLLLWEAQGIVRVWMRIGAD